MSPAWFKFREFEVDPANFQLCRSGRPVQIERIPMELLLILVEKSGQLVNRTEIVERIWGKDVFMDAESAVSTAVRKLRHVLGDDTSHPKYIETVPAKGYRFIAPLRAPGAPPFEGHNLAVISAATPAGQPSSRSPLDFLGVLTAMMKAGSGPHGPWRRHPVLWSTLAVLVLALVATGVGWLSALALGFSHFRETQPTDHMLRYTIGVPGINSVHSFAISPDGRLVVIAGNHGKNQLWLRRMDALQAQPIPLTKDATYPFWSPDSRYIGFFADGQLKKIAASGGPPQSLCAAPFGLGGSWNRDDVIVFSSAKNRTFIQRIAAGGGHPSDVTKIRGNYRHPVFLPDGRHFLYLASGSPGQDGVYVGSLDGNETRRVLSDISAAVFAPAPAQSRTRVGHILFVRENTLMAQPFDPGPAQIAGDAFTVAEGVNVTVDNTYAPVTVSDDGVLLCARGWADESNQIVWYDRSGKFLGPVGQPGAVRYPSLSPDGRTIAFHRIRGAVSDLWLRDLKRESEIRFTADNSGNNAPFWSPSGEHVVFASARKTGIFNLYQKATKGGPDELLLESANSKFPSQWSRDGRFVVYMEQDPKTKADIWVLPVSGLTAPGNNAQPAIPFLHSEFNELSGQLSPDSHWMAYTSDESGSREVYVRPFPSGEGQWKVSIAGGGQPRWRGDGKELYFEAADGKMMAVPVRSVTRAKPAFEPGGPQPLFDAHMTRAGGDGLYQYDVTGDGKRFLVNTINAGDAASAPYLTVVVNWLAGAKNRRTTDDLQTGSIGFQGVRP